MSALEKLFSEDLVWTALSSSLKSARRRSGTGFISINCPMCVHRGETQDKRQRCGIKYDAKGIGIHCFNCGFKSRFRKGETLSRTMQDFLMEVGVSSMEVKRLAHWAFTLSRMVADNPAAQEVAKVSNIIDFPAKALPKGARSLAEWAEDRCEDPDFLTAVEYLFSRGDDLVGATTYYWTPEDGGHHLNKRLIIPCFHEGKMVGWTARATVPDINPRYYNETPSNLLFNTAALTAPERRFVIIVEGIFDALALDAVGTLGARLNDKQIAWIKNCGKTPIVLPDRDKAGQRLIDVAVANDFHVAFPRLSDGHGYANWWEADVKDAAQAVQRYGRLYTLRSVLETATSNRMQITLYRKMLA